MLPPTAKTTLLTENSYSILFSNVSVVLAIGDIATSPRNVRYTGTPVVRRVSRLRCGVSSSTGAENERQAAASLGAPRDHPGSSRLTRQNGEMSVGVIQANRSFTAAFLNKSKICLVQSTPQSNYLTPLFGDSVLSPYSLIPNFSSDMSLLARYGPLSRNRVVHVVGRGL